MVSQRGQEKREALRRRPVGWSAPNHIILRVHVLAQEEGLSDSAWVARALEPVVQKAEQKAQQDGLIAVSS